MLSSEAVPFVPGAKAHCPISRREYFQKVLETLDTPGGVPSHQFHIKFRADHGLDWESEWAGIEKLEDLVRNESGPPCGRWTENGRLVYGTEKVILRRVVLSQKPPAPLSTITGDKSRQTASISIIPLLRYSFENYDVRKKTTTYFQNTPKGINVRIKKSGSNKEDIHRLKNFPWTIHNVKPWYEYQISVQYQTEHGLSLYSEETPLYNGNLSSIFDFNSWEDEFEWAQYYTEYSEKLDFQTIRKASLKFPQDYAKWVKSLKNSDKLAPKRFDCIDVQPYRLSGPRALIRNYSTFPEKVKELLLQFSDFIIAVHIVLTNRKGRRRIAILNGFTTEVKHISNEF